MSGGSWEYFYHKVNDVVERLAESKDPMRRAFGKHMEKVSKAMKDIEWVDSGDCSDGDEIPAIIDALGKTAPQAVIMEMIENADLLLKDVAALSATLRKSIEDAKALVKP